MRWGTRWFTLAWLAVLAAGCLDARSSVCGDGRICAPGTRCVVIDDDLAVCADDSQTGACEDRGDGSSCAAEGIPVGTCISGVCLPSGCGNGVIEEGEFCDDGNTLNGDYCSADCLSDETCGNGIVDRDEQCDCGSGTTLNPECPEPNSVDTGLCRTDCRLHCGDGIRSPGEGCDPGVNGGMISCAGLQFFDRGTTTCSATCQPVISIDTCKYIGWRTRIVYNAGAEATDAAPVTAADGFFVSVAGASRYQNYIGDLAELYETPVPMTAVWAAGADDAVAVGEGGYIIHWTGSGWVTRTSGTAAHLRAVWGRTIDDVYAVGDGSTVLHWNGGGWSAITVPDIGQLRAVAGDAERVYVAGEQGRLLVGDADGWQVVDTGTTRNLHGVYSAGGLVVAVGAAGTIRQNDGTGWVAGRTAATADLNGVWGSAEDGFFAVGDSDTLLFHDGRVWRPLAPGRSPDLLNQSDQDFLQIDGIPGALVGALGTYSIITYEGAAWSPVAVPTGQSLLGLWGSATDDVYAVGRNGTILHHDGLTWEVMPSGVTVDLHAVSGVPSGPVFAAGEDHTLLRRDGGAWTTLHSGPQGEFTDELRALYAAAPDRVFAGGDDGVFEYDGATLLDHIPMRTYGLWGTSPTSVWIAGESLSNPFTSEVGPGFGFWLDVHGRGPDDIYAVTESIAMHFDGAGWTSQYAAGHNTGVAASPDPDVGAFSVGLHGGLARVGDPGEPMLSRTNVDLRAVYVAGRVVFMAGDDGTLDVMVFHR